jgi:ferredoxin
MPLQKVLIDDTCTACQLCIDSCPDVFEMGDEFAQVIQSADLKTHEKCIRDAAEDCPVGAIKIE